MNNAFWNPYANMSAISRRALGISAVIAVLLLWSALSISGAVGPNKLPSPWKVAHAMSYLAWDNGKSLLWPAIVSSVTRVAFAAALVIIIGIPLGVLMGSAPRLNAIFSPLIDPFRSAPIVSLLPILVMWLGIEESMKITFLFLGAVVYLVPMVRDAILAVPQSYWISARDLGATPFEAIRKAVLPMAMPRIADSVIVAVSVMWTYITVAEYVNAKEGLGQLIQNSRRFSAMDQVFAGIIVIIALALITYQVMTYLKRKFYSWETKV
jgi:ABC-type nitrate/sulfonate/bicarbonate transport system permease component